MKNNELPSMDFSQFWITYLNDTMTFPTMDDLSDGRVEPVLSDDDQSFIFPQG